ncbi:MAG: translocation/assembly module TamB domain-containing protein [Myxococcales bacterium]|nr:translocation/assembly module TamB domain-containing protein [Myxococcales bacterium]
MRYYPLFSRASILTSSAKSPSTQPWLRLLRRIGLGSLILISGLVLILSLILSTTIGLKLIRRSTLTLLSPFMTGGLHIGTVEGRVLGPMTLRDIRIRDPEGRSAVEIDQLAVAWRPWALLRGHIRIDHIVINGPRIRAIRTSTGGLNLTQLVHTATVSPPSPSPEPSGAWGMPSLDLGALHIQGGQVRYHQDGQPVVNIQKLSIQLHGSGKGQTAQMTLSKLSAEVQDAVPLSLALQSKLRGSTIHVQDVQLRAGEGRVETSSLSIALAQPALSSGNLRIRLPAKTVRRLGGPSDLLADLNLDATLTSQPSIRSATPDAAPPRTMTVRMRGSIGEEGRLDVDLGINPKSGLLNLKLGLSHLDPATIWSGLPDGELQATLTMSGAPQQAKLTSHVTIDGWVRPPNAPRPVPIHKLQIAAESLKSTARISVKGRIDAAQVDGRAQLNQLHTLTPHLEHGWVTATIPQLETLLGPQTVGDLTLTATATGPIQALTTQGQLDVRRFRWAPKTPKSTAVVTWNFSGLPHQPRGQAQAKINLFNAGSIRAKLRCISKGKNSPHLTATAQVHQLKLAHLPRRFLPSEASALEGTLRAKLHATGQLPNIRLRLNLSLAEVRIEPDRPPFDAQLMIRARPQHLHARAKTQGFADIAQIHLQSSLPKDFSDRSAWQRWLRKPIDQLTLRLASLDLDQLSAIAGIPSLVGGQLSSVIAIQNRGQRALFTVEAPEVTLNTGSDRVSIGFDGQINFKSGTLTTRFHPHNNLLGSGSSTATIAAPNNVFDFRAWKKLGPSALEIIQTEINQIELGPWSQLSSATPIEGQLSLSINRAGPNAPLTAAIQNHNLRLPWFGGSWHNRITATLGETTSAKLQVKMRDQPVLSLQANTPVALAKLLSKQAQKSLLNAPVHGEMRIKNLDLSQLLPKDSPLAGELGGQLEADSHITGHWKNPRGYLSLKTMDLLLAGQPFEEFTVEGRLQDQQLLLTGVIAPSSKQELRWTASVKNLSQTPTTTGHLTAESFPLKFLSRLGVIPFGMDGNMYGDIAIHTSPKLSPKGWAELRNVRLVFGQSALEPITRGNLRVDIDPQTIEASVQAHATGGKVQGRFAAHLPTPKSQPTTPLQFGGKAQLTKFPLNVGQRARVDLGLEIDGTVSKDGRTKVSIKLDRGFVTLPKETIRNLHPTGSPAEVEFVSRLTPPTHPKGARTSSPIEVSIQAKRPIDIRGGPMDARMDMDLIYRAAMPQENGLRGRLWVPEGTIVLFGRSYRIQQAEITLDGQEPPDPHLDIRLGHEFVDDGLTLVVHVLGTSQRPRIKLSSSPARYAHSELLQIFMGTPPSQLGRSDDRSTTQKAAGAALGLLTSQLQAELGQALPLDTLDVELNDEGVSSLTLGKWLTREIFLAYRYNNTSQPDQENDSEAVMQYRFVPGWMVEAVIGLVRQEVDLLWLKRF